MCDAIRHYADITMFFLLSDYHRDMKIMNNNSALSLLLTVNYLKIMNNNSALSLLLTANYLKIMNNNSALSLLLTVNYLNRRIRDCLKLNTLLYFHLTTYYELSFMKRSPAYCFLHACKNMTFIFRSQAPPTLCS
jgi:hypothetical protein